MKRNMHAADRIVRAVLAAAAVWLAIAVGAGTVGGVIALVFAAIMAATAISGFCPLYLLPAASAGAGSWPEPGRDGRARVGPATAWGCCRVSLGACDVPPRSGWLRAASRSITSPRYRQPREGHNEHLPVRSIAVGLTVGVWRRQMWPPRNG